MGYHVVKIEKGEFGTIEKIQEELDELRDAVAQKARIMELCELADILGAIEGYLLKNFPGFTFEDLRKMSLLTKSAFEDGTRK
jgi:hypothetical protein